MAARKNVAKKRTARHVANGTGMARLSSRPIWQGNLKLSLVSCAVALYGAVSRENDIAFHLLNPKTHNRIRMVPTDPDTGPVERGNLVKGYEIKKNKYVLLDDTDLDKVHLETTHTLEIERFIEANAIDRIYWSAPYYMVPIDNEGAEAFVVIREALEKTNRIGLGRIVMHTHERLLALEPRDKGIVATTLRMKNEVVDHAKAFAHVPSARPPKNMIEIAERLIEQKKGAFDPDRFEDRYESALRELIRRKQKGEKLVTAEPVEETNVIDLMDALKRSLKNKGKSHQPANTSRRRRAR